MVSPIALSPCECISSSRLFAESLRVNILERRPRVAILVLGIGLLVKLPRLGRCRRERDKLDRQA